MIKFFLVLLSVIILSVWHLNRKVIDPQQFVLNYGVEYPEKSNQLYYHVNGPVVSMLVFHLGKEDSEEWMGKIIVRKDKLIDFYGVKEFFFNGKDQYDEILLEHISFGEFKSNPGKINSLYYYPDKVKTIDYNITNSVRISLAYSEKNDKIYLYRFKS